MTREEAKELLLHILMTYEPKDQYGDYNDPEPYEQALTMAIEALSADTVSREFYEATIKVNHGLVKENSELKEQIESAEPTVIRSKTLMPTKDFKEWAKRVREENPNAIIIPCDAEVVSAELTLQTPQTYGKSINPSNAEVVADLISRAEAIEIACRFADKSYYKEEIEAEFDLLPSADRPTELLDDGTLKVNVQNGAEVSRVLVWGDDGCGGLYYADDRPSGEWKLASEELPQSVGSYIVTCKDEYGQVYVDYDFWTVADVFKYNCSKVTAWIPFPKPYCVEEMKGEKQMSVSKWAYTEECNGKFCCGECDLCHDRPEEKEEDDD